MALETRALRDFRDLTSHYFSLCSHSCSCSFIPYLYFALSVIAISKPGLFLGFECLMVPFARAGQLKSEVVSWSKAALYKKLRSSDPPFSFHVPVHSTFSHIPHPSTPIPSFLHPLLKYKSILDQDTLFALLESRTSLTVMAATSQQVSISLKQDEGVQSTLHNDVTVCLQAAVCVLSLSNRRWSCPKIRP